eukprot:4810043-Pyramimonas_sp.AAC.1
MPSDAETVVSGASGSGDRGAEQEAYMSTRMRAVQTQTNGTEQPAEGVPADPWARAAETATGASPRSMD